MKIIFVDPDGNELNLQKADVEAIQEMISQGRIGFAEEGEENLVKHGLTHEDILRQIRKAVGMDN